MIKTKILQCAKDKNITTQNQPSCSSRVLNLNALWAQLSFRSLTKFICTCFAMTSILPILFCNYRHTQTQTFIFLRYILYAISFSGRHLPSYWFQCFFVSFFPGCFDLSLTRGRVRVRRVKFDLTMPSWLGSLKSKKPNYPQWITKWIQLIKTKYTIKDEERFTKLFIISTLPLYWPA